MGFLMRHYEKILLAALLSVFIGLLALQLVLWRQNEQIQVEKMKGFKEPPPNYVQIQFDDKKSPFRALESLPEKPQWNVAGTREGNTTLFTDFMVSYPMALCPYCNRVIPASSFPTGDGAGKCPFPDCRKTLHAPYNSAQEKESDSDFDGIPDKEEIRLGLNPKDASDADADYDDDGFSNYEEFISKTDHKNTMDRPRYHEKLFVRSVTRAKLPFRLKNVSFTGSREKQNAQVQMELERFRGRVRTQDKFLKLNDLFQSLAGQFKVVDLNPKFVRSANGIEENQSTVTVRKMSTGENIVLEIGKVIYEPRVKAVLGINLVNDSKDFEVFEKSKFSVGKMKTGIDTYSVVKIDQNKNTVTVKFERDGKEYLIGTQPLLQQKINAVRKANRPRRGKKEKNINQ